MRLLIIRAEMEVYIFYMELQNHILQPTDLDQTHEVTIHETCSTCPGCRADEI